MTISYNWLCDLLPEKIEVEKLSKILTSIGLEVESVESYEEVKGGLNGLVIGEVVECEKHPDADKLSLTKVNVGNADLLQIVCGAPNVAVGQKVVVATVGSTIYPSNGEPLTMKKAKIRGVESHGMICAEDEIGLGNSHAGIMILPANVTVGTSATEYFKPYNDYIIEIGLTPNHMDAMCHYGVAKDVCVYLSHHNKKNTAPKNIYASGFKVDNQGLQFDVQVENNEACPRYAGVSIEGVIVKESPIWLQQKLKAIGLKPINNIVDITNYILQETGQPLHAFDADEIAGKKVIVKTLPTNTTFLSLDEKERKLTADDLMICDGESKPMCIGGVFGGLNSGIKSTTKNIFLESAWFNTTYIRKSSMHHGLRTDAATRFEKGVDIGNTVNVLKKAAMLIKEIAGGEIASDIIDIYPTPNQKNQIALKYHYLKKLSGKNYHGDTVKDILTNLGFEIVKDSIDELWVNAPFNKPDITLAADVVEEIMRIDGLDNIEIPQFISIAPSVETLAYQTQYQEKISNYLVGLGFNEIFTNSITNSAFFDDATLQSSVKMINNLSADLNIMRPSMLQTGLQSIAHNINRKNNDIKFFEFGKIYNTYEVGKYVETNHLCLYITGNINNTDWKTKATKTDIYFLKAVVENTLINMGIADTEAKVEGEAITFSKDKNQLAELTTVAQKILQQFDIKQPVYFANFNWDKLIKASKKQNITYIELSKFPAVQRDLALVLNKEISYQQIQTATQQLKIGKLKNMHLFDIFEGEKLGANKKSMAISYTFLDEEKTLTDKEIDGMMNKLITTYEKELNAEIRK